MVTMGAFKKAVKQDLKLRLAITGPAGSGKTYTALRIATAMGLSIAYIDTEHGSASKYGDLFDFDVMEMQPPYNPERFVKGIQVAASEGYKVVVIDSLSHAWNGTGGILELVEEASTRTKGNSYAAWKDVTPKHNALIEAIVGSDIHIIATMRSKMDYVQDKDDRGKTTITKVGMAPVQREGFEYEFDVVMDMDIKHNGIITKTRCTALTDKVFRLPGEDMAGILQAWLDRGEKNAPRPTTPATEDVDFERKTDNDAPMGKVDYLATFDKLQGDCGKFAQWCKNTHVNSNGPASDAQYQYLVGVINAITESSTSHRQILGVLVGRDVDSSNPPGRDLCSKLLDWLPAEKTDKETGEKVPNPTYKPEYAQCVKNIWHVVRGQLELFGETA